MSLIGRNLIEPRRDIGSLLFMFESRIVQIPDSVFAALEYDAIKDWSLYENADEGIIPRIIKLDNLDFLLALKSLHDYFRREYSIVFYDGALYLCKTSFLIETTLKVNE